MVGINLVGLAGFLILMFVPQDLSGVQYFAACIVTIAVVRATTILSKRGKKESHEIIIYTVRQCTGQSGMVQQ